MLSPQLSLLLPLIIADIMPPLLMPLHITPLLILITIDHFQIIFIILPFRRHTPLALFHYYYDISLLMLSPAICAFATIAFRLRHDTLSLIFRHYAAIDDRCWLSAAC
jgi:hypothetical protein